jgi:hypothetical protein
MEVVLVKVHVDFTEERVCAGIQKIDLLVWTSPATNLENVLYTRQQ